MHIGTQGNKKDEEMDMGPDFLKREGQSYNIHDGKPEDLTQPILDTPEPVQAKAPTKAVQKPATLQDATDQRAIAANTEQFTQNMQQFAVPVTPQQWNVISQAAAQSKNPEEELQRYAAALTYSREFGVDVDYALDNLDAFNEHQLGKPYSPDASNGQAIMNSFKVSAHTSDRMKLTDEYRRIDMKGGDISEIERQIQAIDGQLEPLRDDAPRNWAINLLKLGAENSSYLFDIASYSMAVGGGTALAIGALVTASGLTLATGGLASPLAASVIPFSMGTLATAGVTAATMLKAGEMEHGTLYYDLRSKGISKDIANYTSAASGLATGLTEALFNQIGGAAFKQMGKTSFIGNASSKIVQKFALSGTLGTIAKGLTDYFLEAGGEFGQEWIQSISSSVAEEAAFALSDIISPERSMPILKQAFEEGMAGFGVGLLMGAGTAPLNISYDVQQASATKKTAANYLSKEAFVDMMHEQKPEGVTGGDWSEGTSKLWENQHKNETPEVKAARETYETKQEVVKDLTALEEREQKRVEEEKLFAEEIQKEKEAQRGAQKEERQLSATIEDEVEAEPVMQTEAEAMADEPKATATEPTTATLTKEEEINERVRLFEERMERERDADYQQYLSLKEKSDKVNKTKEQTAEEQKAVNELDFGAGETPKGPVRRLNSNELYTSEDGTPTVDTSGAEHHRMLVGDPTTGSRYGMIEYDIKDNTLTINEVRVKDTYESIRQEAVVALAKQFPGYEIQWEAKGENLQAVKDAIIENNPRGKDAGMQYWDGVTDVDERIEIEKTINTAMPGLNAAERALSATMIQLMAEADGLSTQAYLDKNFKDGKIFGSADEVEAALQGKKGAVAFTNDMKAIIYAGENADISTFIHETFHVALRNMGQSEQFRTAVTEAAQTEEFKTWLDDHAELFAGDQFDGRDAQGLAQIAADFNTDEWSRIHEEFAVRMYEGYQADGKTASPKLQGLFQRIAEWMNKIYTTLKHSVDLDPRITAVFDAMLDKDSAIAKTAQEKQETSETKPTAQQQTLFQEIDAKSQYDAVVSKYRGTDAWMKAPNGKDTNLTERQWVQTRTPTFLAWFGDWLNDPKNASKVVDENGEPLVVYHGTEEQFEIFKDDKSYENLGFYFSDDINIADSYTANKQAGSYFLNLRTPQENDAREGGWKEIGYSAVEDDYDYVLTGFDKDGKLVEEFLDFNVDWEERAEELGITDSEAILASDYATETTRDITWDAKKIGKDGSIVKNVLDIGPYNGGEISNVYVAFSPTQIKSATGNNGAFSNDNPSILFQEASYVRKHDSENGMSRSGYAMFVDSKEFDSIENGYGKNTFTYDRTGATFISDLNDHILKAWNKLKKTEDFNTEYGDLSSHEELSDEKFLEMFNPENIVDSAAAYDDESLISWLFNEVLDPLDVIAIETYNGAIVFDESLIKRNDSYTNTLFQEDTGNVTEQILEDARGFETWEGLKYYYEGVYGFNEYGEQLGESYQDDAWYQAVFNEANGISETAAKSVEPQMSPAARLADEQHKDEYIREKFQSDEDLTAFMEKMGWVLTTNEFANGSPSKEDRQFAETIQELRDTIPTMVHRTVISNAKRTVGGKSITPSSLKRIRTLMTGDSIRYYRDIYADVMEDPQLKPQVIDERLPTIESPGYNVSGFSIVERIKLADKIEAAPLKKAILSGKETLEGSAEKVIIDMDRDIAGLNKQKEKLEAELEAMQDKLSESEMWSVHYAKEYNEASRMLDAELKAIRKLTNEDRQATAEQMKSATRLQKKVDLLHDQVIKNRASERVNATVKRQEALADLKAKLQEKQATKDEAKKVREYKLRLARSIMVKPSDAINYDQAQLIFKIQATLDPAFRQKSLQMDIDGEPQRVTIAEAKQAMEGVSEEELIEAVGQRLYERITEQRKPLNDWTIAELEETLETIADLRTEGRTILAAKNEQKQIIARNYQDSIIRSLMATGKYTSQPWVGTKEEQKERTHPKNTARGLFYSTYSMRVKAMKLDNNTEGSAYNLLVTMKRAAQDVEYKAIERRMEPVFKVMKELGISEKELYKTEFIRLGEKTKEYTYSAMMYIWLSQHEEANRNAVAYGNIVSKDEKIALNHDNETIKELGDARYDQLLEQVHNFLIGQDESGKYMTVVKAVQEDFNAQAPRLNEVAIREFNKAMRVVAQYLPIHRREFSGTDMRHQVAEDLFNANAGPNATSVAKGFTKSRISISPDHQLPVNLDLMGVWNKSVRQQEHFIAFAEYGRTLNRVFKNQGSRDLENAINRTYGKEMYQDVTEYINQVINPKVEKKLEGLEKGVRFMRGNLASAYLGWKMSIIALQGISSPMPFLGDIRADRLIKASFDVFAHPVKSIEFINEKSSMMKNRTMSVVIDLILQQSRTYTDNVLMKLNHKQQEIGSLGMILIDRYIVSGGWMAAYQQKLGELEASGMVTAEADAQAVVYADDLVLKTQPTGDATELAPLFRAGGEFGRAFTQFTTSLNWIWANLTYDVPVAFNDATNKSLPDAVRKQQFSFAVGKIVGYAMAGALLGAVMEGHDDDDDEIDKLRNWFYWFFTQATASVPLIGDIVDNVVEGLITGDKPIYWGDEFFPGLKKVLQGVGYLTTKEIGKGLKNLAEGGGLLTGLPVSGTKQMIKAVNEGPGAFVGR